ncbi:MAG: tetratricopeptide repeat protein [Pyrinomonadaceae bacterium]
MNANVKYLTWLRLLIVLTLLYVSQVTGQIAGGLSETTNTFHGGNNFIVGSVFLPTGVPVNTRMPIRLSSPTSGDVIASTDDRGRFVFSRVGAGNYSVIIEGDSDYEPVTQQVDIRVARNPVPETYSITIRLLERKKATPKADKPSVISAANAGVPKRALEQYDKAIKLRDSNDIKQAIEHLRSAISEYPAFVSALNELGVIYMRSNELDKADEALRAALAQNSQAYEPLINRGIVLFRMGKFADAEPIIRRALQAKAESATAFYYLGRLLNKIGRNDEAEAAFLSCLKFGIDEYKEAHRLLAVIYLEKGLFGRVIEELETYLRLVPTAPDVDDLRKVIEQCRTALKVPSTK